MHFPPTQRQINSTPTPTATTSTSTADDAEADHDDGAAAAATIAQLQAELAAARRDAAAAETWRAESADVCAALTVRLRELAVFMDTLLRNDSVLGALAHDRQRAIRRAVDSSLNMSQSLLMNATGGGGGASALGGSFADFSSSRLSLQLNDTALMAQIHAHLAAATAAEADDKENTPPRPMPPTAALPERRQQLQVEDLDSNGVLEELRAEVLALRAELNERCPDRPASPEYDYQPPVLELNRSAVRFLDQMPLYVPSPFRSRDGGVMVAPAVALAVADDRAAESDACWSEPDRQVSQDRIGLPVDRDTSLALRKMMPGVLRSEQERAAAAAAAAAVAASKDAEVGDGGDGEEEEVELEPSGRQSVQSDSTSASVPTDAQVGFVCVPFYVISCQLRWFFSIREIRLGNCVIYISI